MHTTATVSTTSAIAISDESTSVSEEPSDQTIEAEISEPQAANLLRVQRGVSDHHNLCPRIVLLQVRG